MDYSKHRLLAASLTQPLVPFTSKFPVSPWTLSTSHPLQFKWPRSLAPHHCWRCGRCGRPWFWRCSELQPSGALRSLLHFMSPGPVGCLVQKRQESVELQGLLSLNFSQLSVDWAATELIRAAFEHKTPHLPRTNTHTLFAFPFWSSSSSFLCPIHCELGLGRIHWQTPPLDFILH
jgi:hypothetical protein